MESNNSIFQVKDIRYKTGGIENLTTQRFTLSIF